MVNSSDRGFMACPRSARSRCGSLLRLASAVGAVCPRQGGRRKEFEAELDKWNYNTPGANSVRRGDMRYWTQEELEHLDLSDVEGIPLHILADVLKRLAA